MPTELIQLLRDLHLMDVLLFGTIVGFAFAGFSKGMVKLLIILASVYAGFVLGAIYYHPLAGLLGSAFNISLTRAAEVLAFLLINAVTAVVLSAILFQFFGHLEISGRGGACIDRPLGMLLGFLTGLAVTSIIVVLIEVPFSIYSELQFAGDQAPYLVVFNDWYQKSILGPILQKGLPVLMTSISPLLGGHPPPILVKAPGAGFLPLCEAWRFLHGG